MSVPSAIGTQPALTAAAEPPEEPPGVRDRSQGLRVRPQSALSVKPEWANSGVVVLPMTMAPAARSRATMIGSRSGTQCSRISEPWVVRLPFIGVKSLIAIGTPWSGPSGAPRARRRSAARARVRASSP